MGRLANKCLPSLIFISLQFYSKWYPCRVVKNENYPNQQEPLLGAPGFLPYREKKVFKIENLGHLVVEWLPYRGNRYHNVLTHNRVISQYPDDYFFASEAHKSGILEGFYYY
jgi:hypothetical protein